MSDRIEFWSVHNAASEERFCLCEEKESAEYICKILNEARTNSDQAPDFEIRHEEVVVDIDLNIRDY